MLKSWADESLKKIVDPKNLKSVVEGIRDRNKTIATLNGSFDLLHAGHLQSIFEASQQAEVLIVALNTDKSIQTYKSKDRPIIPLKYRLQMMAALEMVDFVTYFDETDPRAFLRIVCPDVHTNGAEYTEDCIEKETLEEIGAKLHLVTLVPGLSTSSILEKIVQCDSLAHCPTKK